MTTYNHEHVWGAWGEWQGVNSLMRKRSRRCIEGMCPSVEHEAGYNQVEAYDLIEVDPRLVAALPQIIASFRAMSSMSGNITDGATEVPE